MPIKEAIKILFVKCDVTLTEVVKRLNAKYNRTDTVQNLSKKINNGTLRYNEAEEIANVLGCSIEWVPIKNDGYKYKVGQVVVISRTPVYADKYTPRLGETCYIDQLDYKKYNGTPIHVCSFKDPQGLQEWVADEHIEPTPWMKEEYEAKMK